jgi:hypothetical protein
MNKYFFVSITIFVKRVKNHKIIFKIVWFILQTILPSKPQSPVVVVAFSNKIY